VAWGPLLAAWLTLHWGILPHIDEWRPQVERRAGSALGLPLSVGNISVRSAGWVPAFELQDVRVFDRQGREALRLDDADGVTWRDWQSAGGELASAPSCIARTPSIVDCFARGTDNGVWQRSLVNGAWNDWSSLGGNLAGAPTAAALGSNAVVLLASSLNKMFTRGWVDGYGWGEWFKPWGDVTLSAKSSAGCDGWEGGIGAVDSTGVVNYPTSVFCVIRDGDTSFRQLADPDPNGDGQPFIGPMQGMEPTPFKPQLYVWKTKNGMLATITIVASNGGPMLQGKYLVGTGWTESFLDLGGGFTSGPTCGPKLCAGRGTDGAIWVAAR
jgi:hypothetical protein